MTSGHIPQDTQQQQGETPLDSKHKSYWWWFLIQFDTEQEALAWTPPEKPKLTYACWRPHKAPTTGQHHVHILFHYKSAVRFSAIQKLKGCKVKYCTNDQQKINYRQYCINDTKPDGKSKNPIGPFQEKGEWGIKMGERNDIIRAATLIRSKRTLEECYQDEELYVIVAKYPKFITDIYNNKPQIQKQVNITLRSWQTYLYNIIDQEQPLERRIFWIWSHKSNTGKSTFIKYLCSKKRVLTHAKKADLLYAYDNHDCICFDISRSNEEESNNLKYLYNMIESLSNQTYHLSGKFHSKMKLVEAHIIVTSNDPPPLDIMPYRFIEINVNDEPYVITNHMSDPTTTIQL